MGMPKPRIYTDGFPVVAHPFQAAIIPALLIELNPRHDDEDRAPDRHGMRFVIGFAMRLPKPGAPGIFPI